MRAVLNIFQIAQTIWKCSSSVYSMTMNTLLERFFATFTSSAPSSSRQPQGDELVAFLNLLENKMTRSSFDKYRQITIDIVSVLLHLRTLLSSAESWQTRSLAFTVSANQLYNLLTHSRYFLFEASKILNQIKMTLDNVRSATTNIGIVTHSSPFDDAPDILKKLWEHFASWITTKTLSSLVVTSFRTMFSEKLSSDFPGNKLFSSLAEDLSLSVSRELASISRGSLKTIPSILFSLFHTASMWLKKQLGFETEETLQLNTQYVHLNKICEIFTTDGVENMESKLSHLHPACPWVKETFRSNDIEGVRNLIMSKTNSLISDITAVVDSRIDSESFSVLASIATWKNILASLEQIRVQVRGAKADSTSTCGAITIIGAPGVGKTITSESMQLAFMQGKDLATTGKINHSFKEYWSLIFTWAKNDVKYSAKHAAWCLTVNEVGSTSEAKKAQTPASEMSCPQSDYPLFIMENTGNGGNMRIDGAAIKDKGKYLHIGQIVGTCNSTDFWHHMNNPEALNRRNTTMLAAVNPLFSSRQNEVRVDHKICHENRQDGSFGMCQLIYTSCYSPTGVSKGVRTGMWDPTSSQTSKVIHFPSSDPGPNKSALSSLYKGFLYSFVGDALVTSNHVETLLSDFSKPTSHSLSTGLFHMVNVAESREKELDGSLITYNIFDALTAHSFMLVSSTTTQSTIDMYRDNRPKMLINYPFGSSNEYPYVESNDFKAYLDQQANDSFTFLDAFNSYLTYISELQLVEGNSSIFDMGPYAMVAFLISEEFREAVSKSPFEVHVKMNPSISLSNKDGVTLHAHLIWKALYNTSSTGRNWPLSQYYLTQSLVCASMWKIHCYVNALDCSSQPRVDLHSKNTACTGYTLPTHLSTHMELDESNGKYFCRHCNTSCDELKPFKPSHYKRNSSGHIVTYHSSHFSKLKEKVASIKARMTQHFADLGGNSDTPDLGPNLMEMDSKISRDYIKMYIHYITTQPGAAMSVFLNFHPVESRFSRRVDVGNSTLSGKLFRVLSSWFFGEDYVPGAFRYDDSSWLTTGLFFSALSLRTLGGWRSALTSFAVSFYSYGPLCFIPIIFRLISFIFCLFILFTCPSGRVCFARWFNICSVVTTQCLTTKISSLSQLTRSGTTTKPSHIGTEDVLCDDVDFSTFNSFINSKCSYEFEKVLCEVYTFESPAFSWRYFIAQFLSFRIPSALLLLFDNFVFRHFRMIWMPISRYITRRVFASFLYSIAPPGLIANIYFASTQHSCFSDASDDMATKSEGSSDVYCSNMRPHATRQVYGPVSIRSSASGIVLPCSQAYRTRFLHLVAYNSKIDSAGAYSNLEARSPLNTASCNNAHYWVLYYMKFCTMTDPIMDAHLADDVRAGRAAVFSRTTTVDSLTGDYFIDSFTRNLAVNVSPEPNTITDATTSYVLTSITQIITNFKFFSERTLVGRMSRDTQRLDNSDYESNLLSCKLIMAHNEYFFHYSSHTRGLNHHYTHQVFSVPRFIGRVTPPGMAPELTTYLLTGAGVLAFYKIIRYLTSIEQSSSQFHTCPTEVAHTVPPEKREKKYDLYIDSTTPDNVTERIKKRSDDVQTITFTDIPKDAKAQWESTVSLEKGARHNIPTNMVNHSLTYQDTVSHIRKHTFKILVKLGSNCQIATVNRIHTSPKAVVFLGNAHATDLRGVYGIPKGLHPTTPGQAKQLIDECKVVCYPLQLFQRAKGGSKTTHFRPYQLVECCSHVEVLRPACGDAVLFIYYFTNTAARESIMSSSYKEYMHLPDQLDPTPMLIGKSLVMFVPATSKHTDPDGKSHVSNPIDDVYVIYLTINRTERTYHGLSFVCECESRQQFNILSKGDSGSPAFLRYGTRYVPFGIHSGVSGGSDIDAIITPVFNGDNDNFIDISSLLRDSQLLAEKVFQSTVFDYDDQDYMLSRNLVTYSHVTIPPHGSIVPPGDTSPKYNHPDNELLNAVKCCTTAEHVGLVRAETFKASPITKHVFKPFPTDVEFESAGIDRSTQYTELAKPLMSSILTSGYDYFEHFGPVQSTVYSLIRARLSEDYLSLSKNPDLMEKLNRWGSPTTMKLLSHNASSSAGSKLTMNDGSVLKRNKDFKNFTPEGAVLLTSAYGHMVDHVNDEAKDGVAPAVFAQIFGKQEVRKKGKAMRGVNNESLFNRISVREALYPLEAFYDTPNTNGELGHAVGMDIATGLPKLIKAMGGFGAVGTACDYSEYDARVPPAIKDLALQSIWWLYRFAGLVSNDPHERSRQLNKFVAQTHSLRVPQTSANGVVYLCSPGVPSGHSATTTFNCLCNLILNYTFIVMSLSSDPARKPAKDFILRKGNWSRIIFFLCYGDDSVFALKDTEESREFVRLLTGGTDFGDAIRAIDLPTQAKKLGMVLTDDKKRIRFEVNTLNFHQDPSDPDWSFCSRTIVTFPGLDGNPDVHLGVLLKSNISKCFFFLLQTPDFKSFDDLSDTWVEQLCSKFESMLREISFYGLLDYILFVKAFISFTKRVTLPPHPSVQGIRVRCPGERRLVTAIDWKEFPSWKDILGCRFGDSIFYKGDDGRLTNRLKVSCKSNARYRAPDSVSKYVDMTPSDFLLEA